MLNLGAVKEFSPLISSRAPFNSSWYAIYSVRLILLNPLDAFQGIYPTLVTFLTLNSDSLFGKEGLRSASTSSRTRHPTYGSGNWKVAYPSTNQSHAQTQDSAVLYVSRSPPSSAKAFLPLVVEEAAVRSYPNATPTSSPGLDAMKSWSGDRR